MIFTLLGLFALVIAQTVDPMQLPLGGVNTAFCGNSGLNPDTASSDFWGGTTGVK